MWLEISIHQTEVVDLLNQKKIPQKSLMGHSHFRVGKMEAERSLMNCLKSELDLNRAGAGNQNALITQAGLLSA